MSSAMQEMPLDEVADCINGTHKRALRRAAENRVPEAIYREAMNGLQAFGLVSDWKFSMIGWRKYREITERGRALLNVIQNDKG